MGRKLIDLEEFVEVYNNFYQSYGSDYSEQKKRKVLSEMYKVHGNTINNLIKRAKDCMLIENIENIENNKVACVEVGETPFYVKHKSTLYDKDGNVKLEWVKSQLDEETYYKNIKLAIADMMEGFEGNAKSTQIPTFSDGDLLTFYPLPDLHFGLLVSKEESNHGYDYDLKIAKRWVSASMEHLVKSSPYSKTAVITDVGDFLHASDNSNRTKSGHILDTDGRHYKIIKIAFEVTRQLIEMALTKHEEVYFYSVPGNHSENSGIYLKAYLDAWFRNEPRVNIIDKNSSQQYHIFGKNILGFSHGHELTPQRCAETLIFDNHEYFSSSKYRYMHFGHFHSNKKFDGNLVNVEIHKNIIPRDSWSESMGFRGHIGEAKSITYHKEFGEIGRSTFNINMIKEEDTQHA
jgi:hypothetical protein